MAKVHYGTSRLYDEYEAIIDAYIQETYGPDYLETIKACLDLTAAQRKYKLLVEVLASLKPSALEVIERPTTDLEHGGDYAPIYAVKNGTTTVIPA